MNCVLNLPQLAPSQQLYNLTSDKLEPAYAEGWIVCVMPEDGLKFGAAY
jgi:hypothetical protein